MAHLPRPIFALHRSLRLECPHFDGSEFRERYSKFEQYFVADLVFDYDKVRIVMLHLEGRALGLHHCYAQKHGTLHQLVWKDYVYSLRKRFRSSMLKDSVVELVTLKRKGTVEEYHNQFVEGILGVLLKRGFLTNSSSMTHGSPSLPSSMPTRSIGSFQASSNAQPVLVLFVLPIVEYTGICCSYLTACVSSTE
ncbi:hypothetical protein CXB51_021869 [Gossypium anomalum]|uniref:Retrotransposon gag domain-containing protein n=1 Tax=Gossypium anomalum TaxID=47600 RepID=A0A8J6CSJ4_9ROSI|nr:hypothetical protein CXB51_021869 [Gossypium anomalum]